MKEFTGEYEIIPETTRGALTRYVEKRIATGGFLRNVLSNDLFGAMATGDNSNLRAIEAITSYIYNYMPSACWGNKENVDNWLKGE